MASSIVNDCVDVIRKARLGIETRKPIATALECIYYCRYDIGQLDSRLIIPFANRLKVVSVILDLVFAQLNNKENKQRILDTIKKRFDNLSDRLDITEPEVVYIETKALTRVVSITPVLDKNRIDWIETIVHIVPDPIVNCRVDSDNVTGLDVSTISGDENLLVDSRSGDAVTMILYEDYLLTFGDANWSEYDLTPTTHEEIEYVPHYESYILTFTRANGQ